MIYKQVTIEAMLPELKGGDIYRTSKGKASITKAAISRASGDLLNQLKGKRIHTIKATISIIDVEVTKAEAEKEELISKGKIE